MVNEPEKSLAESEASDAFVFPASFAQQRLWFLDQLEPGSAVYNISRVARIHARLDVALFERTLGEIVRRHETLRTTFGAEGGEPFQRISSEETVSFAYRDLSGVEADRRSRETRIHVQEDTRKPFDLAKGPLFRTTLLKLSEAEYLFLLSIHHIVSDGWSLGILFGEVAEVYDAFSRGESSPLPPLEIQYADYAVWQREWMQGDRLEQEIRYWRQQLAGAPALLEFPTDFPRPALQTSVGRRIRSVVGSDVVGLLRAFSRSEGVTLFMTLLAAFQVVLSRYSGQEDIVVGSPVAGRNRLETERVVGLFANTLALRTDLSGDPTFREVLRRVRGVTVGAYGHQDVPFEKVVEKLQPRRSLSHGPIVQVFFALENTPRPTGKPSMFTFSPGDAEREVARADIAVFMRDEEGALPFEVEFNVDLFEKETIEGFASHFQTLLAAAVADPGRPISRLPLLTPEERERIAAGSRGPSEPPAPRRSIPEIFEEVARTWPERVALVYGGNRLTYAELNARANQLAHALRDRGIRPGALVAICVQRSLEMVISILGTLKCGAAYVPIDPAYPQDRISYVLADSGSKLVLTDDSSSTRLPDSGLTTLCFEFIATELDGQSGENLVPLAGADDLAYAIYTSGSTGRPKGVLVRHAGVANLFAATRESLGFGENDVWTNFHSTAFDLSVWELWGPLLHGGCLVVVPVETTQTPLEFARLLAGEGVTILSQTPAAARRLAEVRKDPRSRAVDWKLRIVVCGGEALPSDLAADLVSWDVPLWNFYGPTEATVWSTIKRVGPADCTGGFVSIGKPIANTSAYVLDRNNEPVPPGVVGDLYLGGVGLARGYLGRPDLDRERFVSDPWAGPESSERRLYRTGDRARRTPRGDLEFLGRDDHQVKIRGYRVELGEIETALSDHPQVREAAVLIRDGQDGEQQLVAYLATNGPDGPSAAALRSFLAERLPEYMLPQYFVTLDALPLTGNAKIDRQALPAPGGIRPELEKPFVAPRTATEEKVAEIFRRLLSVDRVGSDDDFFELGGHSLKATQVIARVEELFGVDVPLRRLYEAPTVAGLASRIDERRAATSSRSRPPITRVDRSRPLPVSFGQQRLWFLDQLEPGSSSYNISRALRIRGKLDHEALVGALEAICLRHEALRTTFIEAEGTPNQLVSPAPAVSLEERELDSLDADTRQRELARIFSEESARPFDLSAGPLWRLLLLRLGPEEHVLHLSIHHIVSDGWTFGIFFSELGQLYSGLRSGRPAILPELSIQYPDYASWQREWLQGEELERLLSYWRGRLAGAPEVLTVPGARPRPSQAGSRGAFVRRLLEPEIVRSLDALARREGTTRFTALLAAFQAFLSGSAAGRDVVVGTDVANRDRLETERLIGFFVNLLPIRTDFSGNPRFREALARAQESTLGAYSHQELPFEKLVEELRPARVLGVNPLVQVLIVQSPTRGALQVPGLVVEDYPMPVESSRFDLVLFVGERNNRVITSWLGNSDLFDVEAVGRLADRFERLLAAIVEDPDVRLETLVALGEPEKGQDAMDNTGRREVQGVRLRGARRQGLEIDRATEVVEDFLGGVEKFPLVIRPAEGSDLALAEWASYRRDELETKLLKYGSILFRGFGVASSNEFERFASGLCRGDLFGEYGDLPREQVGGRVYGSTPYPADQAILFHNESSHMHRWPMKIWFYSVVAAEKGGETPIVDCRRVLTMLDPALRERFAEKGLMYVRNYTEGLDVSWEQFYGTSDRARVEEMCREAGTEYEWVGERNLRTRQRCPAVVRHPQTGELAFFNQLQLHHVSCLDPAVRDSLTSMMPEEELPRNVYYGDGSSIEGSVMKEVGDVYSQCAAVFPWKVGDVLMLNNMLVAHSRNPYVGPRKIVVAMGEMINQSEVRG
ncbi:MAG: amino acid adenylation domain-containing protein [Acidobacteriota bacterium]|nr:amino acid adenylation domain-containing protein [Acidobacteriota bacterium]